ncbi:hypothetical protein V5N11_011158 [Cardamine amara subsp. amara]|uniref:DUF4283 domain-containing protein n=1 Tax=Cardamine amara subsp. amara TaxID=228776 RepID=A0ABD0ZK09_CARAN
MEDKVVGADLGNGIFQFNFQSEEDLLGVLKNVPYHFDGWMVSLVQWKPIISSSHPSGINFWVKVTGILMHLWEEQTLQAVGKKVRLIREVDVDSGSVNVTVNGFNPLIFQLIVSFAWGDEVVVNLEMTSWLRKPRTKRELDFNGNDYREGHPSKKDGIERQYHKRSDESHSLVRNKGGSSANLSTMGCKLI